MIDTHCHIHDPKFFKDGALELGEARQERVETVVCIGTSAADSARAVRFAQDHQVWAAIAQHPHDADEFDGQAQRIIEQLSMQQRVVAIGECGLDYYYTHSTRENQKGALRWHLALAQRTGLPLLFHIRDAFEDFWTEFDEFHEQQPLRGAIHSFSAGVSELEQALQRGLYVSFNGIMTFTKNPDQIEAVRRAPLNRILLETDAPFLTPVPYRGKVNKPKFVWNVASFIAEVRGESLEVIDETTTRNARELLGI